MLDGVDLGLTDCKAESHCPANICDVCELDASWPIRAKAQRSFDSLHDPAQARMQSICKRCRSDQDGCEPRRLLRLDLDQNPIDTSHLAPVPVADLAIEHVSSDIHISLRISRAE